MILFSETRPPNWPGRFIQTGPTFTDGDFITQWRAWAATLDPPVTPHPADDPPTITATRDAPAASLARDDLPGDVALRGPLAITEYSATTRVPAGWVVRRVAGDALLMEPDA